MNVAPVRGGDGAGPGEVVPAPGVSPDAPAPDVTALVTTMCRAGVTVAVAESLTGGSVTDALVAVPGASGCVRGGVVAYAAEVKHRVLGVAPELLSTHGAVHPDVALAMARGVRALLGSTYGIGTTGVAGPDSQDGRAPGTYHLAVVGPAGSRVVSVVADAGAPRRERSEVRAAARDQALGLLRTCLEEDGPHA